MKVALVCPYDWSHPGGVKSHINGLAAALNRRGWGTEIIAPASENEPGIFAAGKPIPIPFNGSVARLCFSASARALVKSRLLEGDIDLLHVHEPAIPSVSLLALSTSRLPAVATFHASAERSTGYLAARPVLQPALRRLSERIVVSEAARSLISAYFPGRYRKVPNGIDFKTWDQAQPDRELVDTGPLVLFVGRAEPRKGLPVLIDAMDVVRSNLDARLATVGPRPAEVPGWVRAFGPVEGVRLPGIMRAADVFCAPSIGGESFGIVLAEAMAAGTPVVCSALPGYREAAAGAAREVPAGDPTKLAEAICEVLTRQDLRDKLISAGKERARQLDWAVVAEAIIECYSEALS